MVMLPCIDCLDNLSVEDLIRLVLVCDESGNVAWNIDLVEYSGDCLSCGEYESLEDYLRKSITCMNGVYKIRVSQAL